MAYKLGILKLNVFIFATGKSGKTPAIQLRSFQYYLRTAAIGQNFDLVTSTNASRVLKKQVKLIHESSRIECSLLFENDKSAVDSAKIINDFITVMPICE